MNATLLNCLRVALGDLAETDAWTADGVEVHASSFSDDAAVGFAAAVHDAWVQRAELTIAPECVLQAALRRIEKASVPSAHDDDDDDDDDEVRTSISEPTLAGLVVGGFHAIRALGSDDDWLRVRTQVEAACSARDDLQSARDRFISALRRLRRIGAEGPSDKSHDDSSVEIRCFEALHSNIRGDVAARDASASAYTFEHRARRPAEELARSARHEPSEFDETYERELIARLSAPGARSLSVCVTSPARDHDIPVVMRASGWLLHLAFERDGVDVHAADNQISIEPQSPTRAVVRAQQGANRIVSADIEFTSDAWRRRFDAWRG